MSSPVNRDYPRPYKPNRIPLRARIVCVLGAGLLLFYGAISLKHDYFFMPRAGRRMSNSQPTAFHGEPVWIICAALVLASASLLSVVFDHYDKRNNQDKYRRFATITLIAAWVVFILAFLLEVFVFKKSEKVSY